MATAGAAAVPYLETRDRRRQRAVGDASEDRRQFSLLTLAGVGCVGGGERIEDAFGREDTVVRGRAARRSSHFVTRVVFASLQRNYERVCD